MTRPAELVDWDINDVNSTRPDDSIKDNGYAADDVPASGDHNWIFQQLSAWIAYLDPLISGSRTRCLLPADHAAAPIWVQNGNVITSTNASTIWMLIDTVVGERITQVDVDVFGNGVTDVLWGAHIYQNGAFVQTLASTNDVNRAAAWGKLTLASSHLPHTMAAGEKLWVTGFANGGNYLIEGIRITSDFLT